MNRVRTTKATYVAAFLLGALIALIFAAPARSAELFRLDRIDVLIEIYTVPEGAMEQLGITAP